MGGGMDIRGKYRAVTYEAKKKGKICFVIYIAGKRFFFIYDVIVKQKKRKRSANHTRYHYCQPRGNNHRSNKATFENAKV